MVQEYCKITEVWNGVKEEGEETWKPGRQVLHSSPTAFVSLQVELGGFAHVRESF